MILNWQACYTGRRLGGQPSFHAADGTPLVNTSRFPDLQALVRHGHQKLLKMGWYTGNCICPDSAVLQEDTRWAENSYAGDVRMLIDASFDSVKIDNCGDDKGLGFETTLRCAPHVPAASPKQAILQVH